MVSYTAPEVERAAPRFDSIRLENRNTQNRHCDQSPMTDATFHRTCNVPVMEGLLGPA